MNRFPKADNFFFCPFPLVVYGITTGFGKFARTVIPVSKLKYVAL
uniref:Uncharacterized protein n=1 Tax=Anguilla anguilla TaxID=7936 RepID=A0A0E9VQ24_ANGAN